MNHLPCAGALLAALQPHRAARVCGRAAAAPDGVHGQHEHRGGAPNGRVRALCGSSAHRQRMLCAANRSAAGGGAARLPVRDVASEVLSFWRAKATFAAGMSYMGEHVSSCGCRTAPLAPPLAMTPDAFCSVAASTSRPTALEHMKCQQEGLYSSVTTEFACSSVPAKTGVQRDPSCWRHLLSTAAAKLSTSRMSV